MGSKKTISEEQKAALSAIIDAALADVRSTVDIVSLGECRALFRKKVPLSLRSWVAASLLLSCQAAPAGRGRQHSKPQAAKTERETVTPPSQTKAKILAPAPQPAAKTSPKEKHKPEQTRTERPERTEKTAENNQYTRDNRYQGEGVTLFVSAGRRQRFYARVALKLLSDICGVPETAVGDIRTMDNYSFITIDPAVEETITSTLNGSPFKGRPLTVNLARKRDETASPAEIYDEDEPSDDPLLDSSEE